MTEPDDLTLVLIGSLADNDPWDLELWARDDRDADPANTDGTIPRWWRNGRGNYGEVQCATWDQLEDRARKWDAKLTVLGTGAR